MSLHGACKVHEEMPAIEAAGDLLATTPAIAPLVGMNAGLFLR